jgi:hypothetical protein
MVKWHKYHSSAGNHDSKNEKAYFDLWFDLHSGMRLPWLFIVFKRINQVGQVAGKRPARTKFFTGNDSGYSFLGLDGLFRFYPGSDPGIADHHEPRF